VPLFVFFIWLSARFHFIFLDVLSKQKVAIRESFKEHKEIGNSYFAWSLTVSLLMIASFAAVVGVVFVVPSMALKVLFGILFFFVFVAAILFLLIVDELATAAMYQDKRKIRDALTHFFNRDLSVRDIVLYFLIKIGLGIAAGILAMVMMVVVGLIFLLVGALIGLVLGALGVGLIKLLPVLKGLVVALGVFLGIVGLVILGVAYGIVTLPIAIFFHMFRLAFLARWVPEYNLLSLKEETDEPEFPASGMES